MNLQPRCHRPWTGFEVTDHLGDVRPCCWGKRSCGNINDHSAEEIWQGDGFEYYRAKMARGETEDICNPVCPILQGQYVETLQNHSVHAIGHLPGSPLYLRVVPTTACNLRCPMCYQAGAPPTRLPADLFEQLKPWIAGASELQVLGGETFLARQCLEWIDRVNPVDYPGCNLAAITNGLGFSPEVCSLIQKRRWSWILVSIDAASDEVYRRVRGGDFGELLTNLDRLAEARARALSTFEIRFGFTLQMSNLCDALAFMDLCSDYAAMPQYTLVFGDWHEESATTATDVAALVSTFEELDKRVWQRGFGNELMAGAFAALRQRKDALLTAAPPVVRVSMEREISVHAEEQRRSFVQCELRMSSGLAVPSVNTLKETMDAAQARGEGTELAVILDVAETIPGDSIATAVSLLPVQSFWISVPFFVGGEPLSALWILPLVESLQRVGMELGWTQVYVPPLVEELGLDVTNRSLNFETILEYGRRQACALSVVTPMYNCKRYVWRFLDSLRRQRSRSPFEIVLVDDGSTDGTVVSVEQYLARNDADWSVRVLQRKRSLPYRKGTFAFSAGLAREIGARQACGERILFLDPDQEIQPDCVGEHLLWGGRLGGVVIGDRRTASGDIGSAWSELRWSPLSAREDWWLSFFTGNASVDRREFDSAGGFDPNLQYWGLDDTDLAYRLFRARCSVWHTPRAIVYDLAPDRSGGGSTRQERLDSYRLHMEVLYRKYLDPEILTAFRFAWPESL